ncbi:MAG: hypothetical protein ABIQ12_12205 [Opitutaceae bacterium]
MGLPRHHSTAYSALDAAVELETENFTIWLYGKGGAICSWKVE